MIFLKNLYLLEMTFAPGKHEHKVPAFENLGLCPGSRVCGPMRIRSLKNYFFLKYFRSRFHGNLACFSGDFFFHEDDANKWNQNCCYPQQVTVWFWGEEKIKVSPRLCKPFLFHNSLLFNCFFFLVAFFFGVPDYTVALRGKLQCQAKLW